MFKMNNKNEFIRLLSFMRPRIFTYTIGLIGSNSLNASISIIMAFVFKGMIDAAIKGNVSLVIQTAILALVSTVLFNILLPFARYLLNSSIQKTSKDIQMKVYDHLEKLPVSYFEKSHSGDIHSRVNHDTNDMQGAFAQHLNATVASFISGVGSAVVLFIVEWRLGIIVILLGIASLFVNKRFAPAFRYMNSMKNKYYGKLSECMVDNLSGFNVMKIFNIENIVEKRFSDYNDEATKMAIGRGQKHALMSCANTLMSYISFVIIIAIGSLMVMQQMLTFGTVIAVTQLLGNVTGMFLDVGGNYALVQRSLASAVRVFEFLDYPEESESFSVPESHNKKTDSYIEMRGVCFGYDNNTNILNGLSLKVEQGQIAAFVGPSGGGKSTIIKLLMCYYPWKSGEIAITGKPAQEFSVSQIRQMIAYVPQEPYLFDGSIEDNIRYGKIDATEEEIMNAAKAANAHDFIIAQKDGYKTLVGERGVRLSGGQKQRIAIARALLKNAPILLLDEATSSLDSENEQLVQNALNVLMKGRTTLVIAHRLSTIEKADVIYVVDNGCIQEYGVHNKLLEMNGVYKTLYDLQFKNDNLAAAI